MNLLLDTHILIWWLGDSPRLSAAARSAIEEADTVWVSAIAAWEIEVKRARGLLDAPDDLEQVVQERGMKLLPLSVAHAIRAARLPMHHRDPFDRMLVAQTAEEHLTLLTSDSKQQAYNVPVILA